MTYPGDETWKYAGFVMMNATLRQNTNSLNGVSQSTEGSKDRMLVHADALRSSLIDY